MAYLITYKNNMVCVDLKKLKKLSKEKFLKLTGSSEKLYDDLQKSLEGEIIITKISDNDGFLSNGETVYGRTEAFGEGLSLYVSRPSMTYRTSTIQSIDWVNNEFITLNSKYKFNFK